MGRLPAARCHELRENLRGKFAVDLVHPKRLMFEPAHNPVPTLDAGNIDTARIARIKVLEVVDYHGE